jgi:hypothetical protein
LLKDAAIWRFAPQTTNNEFSLFFRPSGAGPETRTFEPSSGRRKNPRAGMPDLQLMFAMSRWHN